MSEIDLTPDISQSTQNDDLSILSSPPAPTSSRAAFGNGSKLAATRLFLEDTPRSKPLASSTNRYNMIQAKAIL